MVATTVLDFTPAVGDLPFTVKQRALLSTANQLGREKFAPRAAQWDDTASFPFANYEDLKNAGFLVPQPALREIFRARFRDAIHALAGECDLPAVDPAVWQQDWGVDIRPFGSGENIIGYLGRYVCRTAIGDSRILEVTDTRVSFRYKDRANGGVERTDTVDGVEFVARYLRHVLPRGMRAVRDYGYFHPAAKAKHERVAFHTGRPLLIGAAAARPPKPPHVVACPCCGAPMRLALRLVPPWRSARPPPPAAQLVCA